MNAAASVPRDTEKMIRQLSLVAFLMAKRGMKVDARTIRWQVEGYGDESQTEEAFARRFYADRDELSDLGIEIESEPDEFGDGDVYWLRKENLFLPPVEFTPDELAALHTCLCLLDGQFAYSRLLRLALQSLALGSGNTLDDQVTGCISVNLLSSGFDAAIAARQARLETAISKRKTITFQYHALARDRVQEREVDPYSLLMTGGDWYLVGFSHERDGIRVFKLRRIQGKIRNATRAEHDFIVPEDFNPQDYAKLKPWQMGTIAGRAEIYISPRMAWWAEVNLSGYGEVETGDDGSAIFRTDYADGDLLASLVLSLSDNARLVGPEDLEADLLRSLERVREAHTGEGPELADPAADQPAAGRTGPPDDEEQPQVEPERFPLLAQTIAYLLDKLGNAEKVTLPVSEACADLGCDRRSLEQDMDLLRVVNAGAGSYSYLLEAYVKGDELEVIACPDSDLMRRPVRLSPREARAMLLAIDLVGHQVLAGQYSSLESAREKIREAAGGLDEEDAIPVDGAGGQDFAVSSAINRGLDEHRLVEIEYLARDGNEAEARVIEPYLLYRTKGQWYLVAWCRTRDDERTFILEMVKSAKLLKEEFEPREIDLERHRKDPQRPSGEKAPHSATVWFSPEVARWVLETAPASTLLKDGSLVATIPYFSPRWLCEEILKYRGEAVVAAPEELRRQVAETAARLAASYR